MELRLTFSHCATDATSLESILWVLFFRGKLGRWQWPPWPCWTHTAALPKAYFHTGAIYLKITHYTDLQNHSTNQALSLAIIPCNHQGSFQPAPANRAHEHIRSTILAPLTMGILPIHSLPPAARVSLLHGLGNTTRKNWKLFWVLFLQQILWVGTGKLKKHGQHSGISRECFIPQTENTRIRRVRGHSGSKAGWNFWL